MYLYNAICSKSHVAVIFAAEIFYKILEFKKFKVIHWGFCVGLSKYDFFFNSKTYGLVGTTDCQSESLQIMNVFLLQLGVWPGLSSLGFGRQSQKSQIPWKFKIALIPV